MNLTHNFLEKVNIETKTNITWKHIKIITIIFKT